MKKVGIVSCVIGLLFVVFGSVMKIKENTAVSIIGGADGPTSVFVAGKMNSNLAVSLIFIGVVLLAICLIVYLKKR